MRPVRLTILIACAATVGVGIYILSPTGNAVRVYSVDGRLRINDAQYFSGTDVGYYYFTSVQKFKLQCIRVLRTLGLGNKPWVRNATPSPAIAFRGPGPALVVCGEVQDANSAQLDLLADNGQRYGTPGMPPQALESKTNTFLWIFLLVKFGDADIDLPLTNGLYHLRPAGETNDFGLVRVRL
jgi:hypothetical protein